nr:pitrilysin family protein [Pigmentibacter ruber]
MRLNMTHFSYFKTFFAFPKKLLLLLSILFPLTIYGVDVEPKLQQTYKIIPGSTIQAFQYKLQNGLQFYIIPDQRNPVATIHFILDAGSNRESKGTTGLAHFFEHMMFRKSEGAPEGNYDKVLNSFGGSGNAGTSDAYVTFYSTFPGPALEQMLKLEANRFLSLDITDPYFSIEKGAVISERKLRVENDPLTRSSEILRAITERNTPLEWMTIGSKQDVENMSIESAKTFYKNFYTPDNTTIFIGGPFDPQKVANLVQKYFGSWKGNLKVTHQKFPTDYLTRDLGKKFVCSAPIYSQKYKITYPTFSKNIHDLVNVIIFKTLLDDHPDGRFERRLVKEKIATDFSFYKVFWQNQSNPLTANFSLNNEQKFENALKFWENGIKEVLNKPISEKIKKQILKQLAVSNAETAEKMTNLVNTIFEDVFFLKSMNTASQIEKLVKSSSTSEFRKWVTENLSNKNNYVTGIVPTGKAESCQDLYTNFLKK